MMVELQDRLSAIFHRQTLPDKTDYSRLVTSAVSSGKSLAKKIRPHTPQKTAGGFIDLPDAPFTIIVPDLHARTDFVYEIITHFWDETKQTTLESLAAGAVNLVFLGDCFHSERRAFKRWIAASQEYSSGQMCGPAMTSEMIDSLSCMELVMELLIAFPTSVFFLKGNHENVLNEDGRGNHSFRKFVDEGNMVSDFLLSSWGTDFLILYSEFERQLPVFLRSSNFLCSHAEPLRFFSYEEIVSYHEYPEVIEGLTWTSNGEAAHNAVESMLAHYISGDPHALYFGGHRIVSGGYAYRANKRFIQIHDPDMPSVAFVSQGKNFDPETDMRRMLT